jgi:histone H3/H4
MSIVNESADSFRVCSVCRSPIAFEARYFRCSVSTCNRKRMPLYFCSVSCWEAHQADARHRDAGAEEVTAPSQAEWAREREEQQKREEHAAPGPVEMRRVVGGAAGDILVVTARLKDYVRDRAHMSTSDRAMTLLSDHLRELLDLAIAAAGRESRKTVLERDLTLPTTESAATGSRDTDDRPDEVLVVVAKVKQYVKARAGMNTSDAVTKVLSAHLRHLSRKAIRSAGADDRRTVMDRDYAAAIRRTQ